MNNDSVDSPVKDRTAQVGPVRPVAPPRRGYNWLVHRIFLEHLHRAAADHARGVLVDVGCGRKPWLSVFSPYVEKYVGVDHVDTLHSLDHADVVADAYDTTLAAASADTVVSLAVLEHLEDPLAALQEMRRVLRPGGKLLLTVPMFWHVHEAPRDFYRYTPFALRYLLQRAGLEVVEIAPMSGFWVTFLQEFCYWLRPNERGILLRPIAGALAAAAQHLGWLLHRYDRRTEFAWMHLVVGRRPAGDEEQDRATTLREGAA